jgi:hypothetical protein
LAGSPEREPPETAEERTGKAPRVTSEKAHQHRKLGHRLLGGTEGITLANASHPNAFDFIEKEIGSGWV